MNKLIFLLFFLLFPKFAFRNTSVKAHAVLKPAPWIVLFDGKTTKGWRGYNEAAFPSKNWKVENGEIIIRKAVTQDKQVDLITEKQYENFILELDFKLSKGGNSGILYHVPEVKGRATWELAPEYQILDDPSYKDDTRNTMTASNYDLDAPSAMVLKPLGQWNHAKLVVNKGHVEHWLNGTKVVSYELGSQTWKKKVSKSKFSPYPDFGMAKTGYIALQDHLEEVHFKNIRLQEL